MGWPVSEIVEFESWDRDENLPNARRKNELPGRILNFENKREKNKRRKVSRHSCWSRGTGG